MTVTYNYGTEYRLYFIDRNAGTRIWRDTVTITIKVKEYKLIKNKLFVKEINELECDNHSAT